MIQNNFKYVFAVSVKCSDYKTSPFVHKLAKTYPFRGRGFHNPVEWKIGYQVINKQVIVQILNTAVYIYVNIRLKEISILNSFEQIQYSSGGFSKSPPNRWGWFFSPLRIFLIPHSNSHRDGFFVHRVSAEFPPQNHPLTCRTPRWAKVYPGELAMKD